MLAGVAAGAALCTPHPVLAFQQPALVVPAGQVELARLLDLAAERLGVRIQYAPELAKGTVTLRVNSSSAMTALELWSLAVEELAARNATVLWQPASGAFIVVKLEIAAQLAPVLRLSAAKELAERFGDSPRPGYVSIQMTVNSRKAAGVVKALQAVAGKAPGSVITQAGDSEVVLISDTWRRAEQLAFLLEQLDSPGEVRLEEYAPAHTSAASLVSQAREIVKQRDAVSGEKTQGDVLSLSDKPTVHIVAPPGTVQFWKELLASLDRRSTLIETRTYSPRNFPVREVGKLVEQVCRDAPSTTPGPAAPNTSAPPAGTSTDPWRLVVDELTGSLIVTATVAQHRKISDLLERLDSVPPGSSQRIRTFSIRNRSVKEVAETLQRLLEAGTIELAPDGPAAVPVRPASPAEPAPKALTVAPRPPDKAGGGASTPLRAKITVDEGTNSLIAVGEPRLLAQVEELLKTLDRRQPQVMIELMLVSLTDGQSLALGAELDKLTSIANGHIRLSSIFSPGANAPNAAPGAGFTGSYINDGDFSAVIRALETINHGRSVSLPRVLVGNNQEATFNSVAQQPTSTTATNSTATTITSFGGFQDAGTKMSVKPQIADGDQLVLTYDIELSAFTGSGQNGLPAPRQQNSVSSVAMIPDGHTVVVGGLELTTDSKDVSQVPLLGGIPLIGELFKTRTTTENRTRFFVFIRANVMRDAGFEDLKYISKVASDSADGLAGQDAPTVEPRVIK